MPWPPEVPTSGFGYPHAGFKLSLPREPLSAPNALELRPSKLYSSRMIGRRFPFPVPLLRFLAKPFRTSRRRFSGFIPSGKPFPLKCNSTFYVESGTVASMGLTTFQALPPKTLPVKHLHSRDSLLALPYLTISQPPGQLALRSLCLRPGISLRKGHRPV